MLTLGEMQVIVTRESGNDQLKVTQIYDIINRVQREVSLLMYPRHMKSTFAFSTVASQGLYNLPPNFSKMIRVRNTTSGSADVVEPVESVDDFWEENPAPALQPEGTPDEYLIDGVDEVGQIDSDGTVAFTLESRIFTGTGTLFITKNIIKGTRLNVNSQEFTVQSVDSETQITTVQKATVTAISQPYTLERIHNQQLRFDPIPDSVYTIEIDYYREPAPMVGSSDLPEIKGGFVDLLIRMAIRDVRQYDEDQTMYLIAANEVERWIQMYRTRNEDELDEPEKIRVDSFTPLI